MEKNLWDLLKRCSEAIWFGYTEGSWIGEENVKDAKESIQLDRRLMEELKHSGYIEVKDKTSSGRSGVIVRDWQLTSSGRHVLLTPPTEHPSNT